MFVYVADSLSQDNQDSQKIKCRKINATLTVPTYKMKKKVLFILYENLFLIRQVHNRQLVL